MIPYFSFTSFQLGPLHIQVWGLCVALGILLGVYAAYVCGRRYGLAQQTVFDLSFWTLCAAFIGARIWYGVFENNFFSFRWLYFFTSNQGFSFSGGLLFAACAILCFSRLRRIPLKISFGILAFGLPFGTMIGRLGCFFIFDHPGSPTESLFGQMYIDGIVRHNHGLYLVLVSALCALIFFILFRYVSGTHLHHYTILCLFWYGITRLILDVYRATDLLQSDVRYFGFTTAQYVACASIVMGMLVWYAHKHEKKQQKAQKDTTSGDYKSRCC